MDPSPAPSPIHAAREPPGATERPSTNPAPPLLIIGYLLWKDAAGTGTADEGDDDLENEDDTTPFPAPAGLDSSADD